MYKSLNSFLAFAYGSQERRAEAAGGAYRTRTVREPVQQWSFFFFVSQSKPRFFPMFFTSRLMCVSEGSVTRDSLGTLTVPQFALNFLTNVGLKHEISKSK